jgi:gliding motility-associated-like protein
MLEMPRPGISIPAFFRTLIVVFVSWFTLSAKGQLCTGSLGDPVVNITFGSGGSNSGYAPTNAYTYINSSCPNDGYYTITNSTSNCFGNSWHTINSDHTGNGAFMLVNASFTPGDFFVTTVDNLCPNTTYEFASWIMNVLNRPGIRPNITFKIETTSGAVLQQYSTGDILETTSPIWKQYGFYFTKPATNTGIVLRMTNNAPGGIGNDIALDDITFRPCGATITSTILGNPDTVHICEGNTNLYTLTSNVSSAYNSPVYQWQVSTDLGITWKDISGANSITYVRNPTTAGIYWYRLAVNEQSSAGILGCRIASNYIVINVHAKPVVDAGADRIIFTGENATLNGNVTGEGPIFYWSPPDNLSNINILDPVASPSIEKKYTLYSTSAFGCKNEDAMTVKVVAGIFVPNAFTPNNDGKNDKWRIPFLDPMLGATVKVYNRYGQIVYQVEGKTVEWDGTFNGEPQGAGTFVYYISFNGRRKDMNGTFVLIR